MGQIDAGGALLWLQFDGALCEVLRKHLFNLTLSILDFPFELLGVLFVAILHEVARLLFELFLLAQVKTVVLRTVFFVLEKI